MAKKPKKRRAPPPGMSAFPARGITISLAEGVHVSLTSNDSSMPYLVKTAERLAQGISRRARGRLENEYEKEIL